MDTQLALPPTRRSRGGRFHLIMHKLFGLVLCAVALAACSNMSGTRSMGNTSNPSETKNSTDANKSSNPAAVSPGGGTGAAR